MATPVSEPARVEEPQAVPDYAAVFSRVAAEGQPLILRRGGEDLAAVIPLEQLRLLLDVLIQREAEHRASQIDWRRLPEGSRAPQSWFDDNDNPCEADDPGAQS